MARYKRMETGVKLLPVDLSHQLLPGNFDSEIKVEANESNADVERCARVIGSHLYPDHARNKT